MTKPELPKKIEPLPATKPAADKKTGWEPPTPQKVRTSETRMGILLAFCLLVAIGFVAYRKLDEKRQKTAKADEFIAAGDTHNADNGAPSEQPEATDEEPSSHPPGPTPVAALSNWATQRQQEPTPSSTPSSTPAGLQFSDSELPDQSEPGANSDDPLFDSATDSHSSPADETSIASDSATTFDPLPGDFGTESEPAAQTVSEDTYNPFAGSETVVETSTPDDAVNPFGASSESDSEQQTVTSDAPTQSIESGSPFDSSEPHYANNDGSPTPHSAATDEVTTSSDSDIVELPVMDLSQDVAVSESLPDQQAEPEADAPANDSPWGSAPAAGLDTPVIADGNPPELLEPNDPQEMPTITLGPFDSPATGAEPLQQPADEPSPVYSRNSAPYPSATATTDVRQPTIEQPPGEADPFGASEPTTITPRAAVTQRDPFTPARDVSQAVNEDEVLVHDVASGENFWSIAQQHYGAGKYFNALAAYNQTRIPDPRRMRPGMKVLVPSKETLAQQYPQLVSGDSTQYIPTPQGPAGFSLDPQGQPQYRVAKGDTLSDIAEKHLGRASRWRQVYGMNRYQLPDENSLTTGMVLRLPPDASQVRMDPARASSR